MGSYKTRNEEMGNENRERRNEEIGWNGRHTRPDEHDELLTEREL